MDIASLAPAQLSAHLRTALASPSGKVLREFLRMHCFMRPGPRADPWEGEARLAFRYGRMTLFQMLEFYEDPRNFPPADRD
ncbi:MAG: hypothetical protein AB1916_16575 [Thermodesulfobacteriota bacterium]